MTLDSLRPITRSRTRSMRRVSASLSGAVRRLSPAAKTESAVVAGATKSRYFSRRSTNVVKKEKKVKKVEKTPIRCGYAMPLFEEQWRRIVEVRSKRDADVDRYGAETLVDEQADEKTQHYQALISVMLSSQTKDPVTAAAMHRLREHGLTIANIMRTEQEDIKRIIYGVGFHNRKALYIKKTTELLHKEHNDDLPNDLATVCSLPGVGQKMAKIALRMAFGNVCGISVDTHVNRVSRRIGWASSKANTPDKVSHEIEQWVPKRLWADFNIVVVGFGQTVCTPLRPKCDSCPLNDICPKNGTKTRN